MKKFLCEQTLFGKFSIIRNCHFNKFLFWPKAKNNIICNCIELISRKYMFFLGIFQIGLIVSTVFSYASVYKSGSLKRKDNLKNKKRKQIENN